MSSFDSPLRVLLVEDNPNDARLIKRSLGTADTALLPADIELTHETDLDGAREVLDTAAIDLCLLDLGLPGSTGVETYHRITDATETVPVIALTGLDDEQAALDLLQAGAQDYLTKDSFEREQLVKSIRYALERQERETELRAKTERLALLNRIFRHDINNDLQIIRNWTTLAAEQATDETATRLERVSETIEHTVELTENSRRLVELVAGDGEATHEPVALDRLLRDAVEKARTKYDYAEFDCSAFPSVTVEATPMLSSVFRNLLNNAIQHNDSDSPRVEVGLEPLDDSVRVTVADNGPGIPDHQKAAVFGKGERGLDSDGTGMGLYLVHTLVTEFGGCVTITDNDPTGSVFVVELPRCEATAHKPASRCRE